MNRIERHQVWIYLAAILAGLGLGTAVPGWRGAFELAVWPALALLLYATFTQVPLTHVPAALRDHRFLGAAVTGNFVVLPLVVWALLGVAPADPAVRIGILLVLLVPCTDWFITFTHLAGGDTRRAIAITPLNLGAQFVLLPFYLWLILGEPLPRLVSAERVTAAFLGLIVLPALAAALTQRQVERSPRHRSLLGRIARIPVPLLALVVFLVAAGQVTTVSGSLALLPRLAVVYAAFLIAAAVVGRVLGAAFALGPGAARTVVFSLGTRNSFVVLPIALALPAGWEVAVIVVVFQSLIELFGMVGYLWGVPRLIPQTTPASRR